MRLLLVAATELDKLALPTGVPIIATAGTATTMAAIQLGLETYAPEAVTGFRMAQAAIEALFSALARSRAGHFETISVADGIHRIVAYRGISDKPLIISATLSKD